MSAPEGNQFWKKRSKHGRDRIFDSPEELWEEVQAYFNWCDENPWIKCEAIKGGEMAGSIVRVPQTRPYTKQGLCVFLNIAQKTWDNYKKRDDSSEDFLQVITRTEEIIYTQKFEGATVGAFNANIISRDLGLADRKELTGKDGKDLPSVVTFRLPDNQRNDREIDEE